VVVQQAQGLQNQEDLVVVLLTEELEDQETLEAIHLLKETMVEMVTLELKVEVAEVLEVLVQTLTKMVETVEVEQLQILVDHLYGGQFSNGSPGGSGGGAANTPGTNGLGGGAGGDKQSFPGPSNGGTGRIILRCPSATGISVTPGTNTVATDAPTGDKIATFNVTGTIEF
jgi:hypothetical protein